MDLDALGFYPALAQLVHDFGDQNQLAARLEIAGPQEALPEVAELPLYRIIQEGLSNVGQHARRKFGCGATAGRSGRRRGRFGA